MKHVISPDSLANLAISTKLPLGGIAPLRWGVRPGGSTFARFSDQNYFPVQGLNRHRYPRSSPLPGVCAEPFRPPRPRRGASSFQAPGSAKLGPESVQSHVSVAEELVPPSQLPAAAELGTASASSSCHHFQDELSFHHVIELKIPGDPVSESRKNCGDNDQ